MIESRARVAAEHERRVDRALAKLVKTGAPFTVENVIALAGVGKTFIYDKRRPGLTRRVLAARDASQQRPAAVAERALDDRAASWRERALNAEALAKSLRLAVRERDARISDLLGQLFDPAGHHLADELTRFRELTAALGRKLSAAEAEIGKLQRSLDASRANVKRERERNVTQLFPEHHPSGG